MALAHAKQQALEDRLSALDLPQGGWAQSARVDALARLRAMGLPGKRDEYWRYTDPASLTQAEAPRAAIFDAGDEAEVFGGIDRLKLG